MPANHLLLAARRVGKTYPLIGTVLADVDLAVNRGDRLGLVGANGAGKTTLLRILVGAEQADAGEFNVPEGVELGYLLQSLPANLWERSLDDVVREAVGGLRQLEERMRALESAMADPAAAADVLDEYGHVAELFEQRGGYTLEHRLDAVLEGLRLAHLPRHQVVGTLSGGERARVGLAALLLRSPDVLLLDEPTNHLDADSLAWLEQYLAAYSGAILAVSHDRRFLNQTVNGIYEVDESTRRLTRYGGDYDAYRSAKSAERARAAEAYEQQQEEIKTLQQALKQGGAARQVSVHNRGPRDNDKFIYAFKGEGVQRAIARNVHAAQERLRRIQSEPLPRPPETLRLSPRFEGADRPRADVVLRLSGVSKSYPGRGFVLREIELDVRPGTRMALIGPNGAGKTTLLRLLAGLEEPDRGEVRRATGLRLAYLAQDPPPVDDPTRTVLAAYRSGFDPAVSEADHVADLLRFGLFRYDDLARPVARLSVGQRRKLELARMIALRPGALLLDEPTNHLSLDVLEAFEAAILEFPGSVIAVSHDRWFLDRFGGRMLRLEDGALHDEGAIATAPWS